MEASTAVSSRLIGAFFVEKELITQEQLELALRKQEVSGERLGEIIVAEFGVSRLELASVLAEQWAEFERDSKAREEQAAPAPAGAAAPGTLPPEAAGAPGASAAPGEPLLRRPIGEIFLERGFVSRDDLDKALDVQRETGTRLGEVLVEQGSLSRLDLASALAEQWSSLQKLRAPEPVPAEPWQNRTPTPPSATVEAPLDLRQALDELEERIRTLEHISAATPWNEDLRLLGDNVRAALAKVEERVTKTATRVDPAQLEALAGALDELQERLQEPTSRLDSVEQRLGELPSAEVLEQRLAELSARTVAADEVASLGARVDALAAGAVPADEVQALRTRLDEIALRMVVPEALGEVRAELAELSRALIPAQELDAVRASLETLAAGSVSADEVAALRARLDGLAEAVVDASALSSLQARVEEIASRTVAAEALEELGRRVDELSERLPAERDAAVADLRRELTELAARSAGDVPREEHELRMQELRSRLDELDAHVQSIDTRNTEPSGPRLREILDGLRAEIDVLAARPVLDPERLEVRLAALEQPGSDPAVESLAAAVEQQRTRLEDRLDELAGNQVDPVVVEELRARIAEALARVDTAASADTVEARLVELEGRLRDTAPLEQVRQQLALLAETAAAERVALEQELRACVDEVAVSTPAVADVAELRARLDELAAREAETSGPTAERLAAVESALVALEGVEWRLQTRLEESVAVRALELGQQLESSLHQLDALGTFEQRIAALEADLELRPGSGALEALAAAVRAELATLAERLGRQERALAELPEPLDPTQRLDDLGLRLDGQARLAAERLGTLRDDLQGSIAEQGAALAAELEQLRRTSAEREQALSQQLAALADRTSVERVEQRLAEHDRQLADTGLRDELASLRAELHDRSAALESSLGEAIAELRSESVGHVEESAQALRHELEGRTAQLGERLGFQESALAGLRGELEELRAAASGQEQWRLQIEAIVRERADELEQRLGADSSETRQRLERSEQALTTEVGSLTARLDELLGLRHQDLQAACSANDELAARVDELHALRDADADAARVAAGELITRMEALATSLRSEAAAAAAAASAAREQIERLAGLREDDLEASRIAGAELVARLDDLAIRSAAAAAEAERALRSDLDALAAAVEERDEAGSGARQQLRLELERAASSLGWRLERIEEALASDEHESLRETIAELEQRLEQQVAVQDEQVRVTERALRKGLASLGERLLETQAGYHEAGSALRRSIERLGAAVVEADARIAEQIPLSELEGYVAFAPTGDGYRLLQVEGRPPQLGATVEVDGVEGPLVVTRLGRSPLPLDLRPCAYLDRP